MPLNYQKKLKIFHDEFVKYAWTYIEIQKNLAAGQSVPHYITPAENQYDTTTTIHIIGSIANWALEFCSLLSNPFKIDLYKSIRDIFPGEPSSVKKILSIAIQEIAVHTESHLSKLENDKEISKLATAVVAKLVYYLSKNKVIECAAADIVTGVLKQYGYFTHDAFVPRNLENLSQSEHYYFISKNEFTGYVALESSSISTEIDSTKEPLNPQISPTLIKYIKTQNSLIEQKQIIIYEKLESLPKFISIGEPEFKSDIESFRIDKIEEITLQITRSLSIKNQLNKPSVFFYNVNRGIGNFVGRDNELDNIKKYFEEHNGAIQIIGGLGGIGKTQAVLKYVNQHKVDYNQRVRWIKADSQESLEKSFREFAEALSLDVKNRDGDYVKRLVLNELQTKIDKSLLVFDNSLEPKTLLNYLPMSADSSVDKKHDIIITTGYIKSWQDSASVVGGNINIIRLPTFSFEDAFDLIKSVLKDVDRGNAKKLADLFSCIPLGLSQSLAFIQVNGATIEEYLERFTRVKTTLENSQSNTQNSQTSSQDFLELIKMLDASFEIGGDAHVENIYVTLNMTLSDIKASYPDAFKIIKLCSYLNADSIPLELFNSFFSDKLYKTKAISILKGYSLLSVSDENHSQFANIHRIVQQIIIHETPLVERSNDIIELAEHIVEQKLFTRDNIVKGKYQNNTKFLLHIESLIRKAKKYSIELNSELVYLELAIAVYHDFNGDHKTAIKKLSMLKESIEELVDDSSNLTIILQNLAAKSPKLPTLYAQVYYHMGKANLSIYLKKITDLNNLDNNINMESLADLEQAVEIRKIIDNDNNSNFNDSYNSGSAERPMDTIIFKRQGILFWKQSQKTEDSLSEALQGYEELINSEQNLPENLRDKFNLDTCRRLYIECSVEMPNFSPDFTNLLKMVGENLSINYGDLDSISEREKLAKQIYQTLESKVNEYFRIAREFNLIGKIFIKIYDFSKSSRDMDLAIKFIQKAKELEESNGLQNFIFKDADTLLEQLNLFKDSITHDQKNIEPSSSASLALRRVSDNLTELQYILESCKQDGTNKRPREENSECDDLIIKSARLPENIENQQHEVANEIVINSAGIVPANNDVALDLINQQNLLLERINKIKEIVGEQSINKYSGFYNYIYNALSNNIFSNSAKQIINVINKLVESLESVINLSISISQENNNLADYGSHLWEYLESLLEFTASGQKFPGFFRPPYFDPDDSSGSGGEGSGFDRVSNENSNHSAQPIVFIPLIGISSNQTTNEEI